MGKDSFNRLRLDYTGCIVVAMTVAITATCCYAGGLGNSPETKSFYDIPCSVISGEK